ncbi:MAG: phosphatidate cytidylyltransferase [Firmicutes bacterium]|nr:phosphatidate cytidylyltransferase [Bacillota bacterium]
MKNRILVGIVGVPILLAIVIFLPLWVFALCLAFVAALGAHEFLRCAAPQAERPAVAVTLCAAVLAPLFAVIPQLTPYRLAPAFLLLIGLGVLLALSYREGRRQITVLECLGAFFAGGLIPYLLGALVRIGQLGVGAGAGQSGAAYILIPFVITFACDTGAYFIGTFLGKHKLSPLLSPHKTVEGSVGGFVCGMGFLPLYGLILQLIGGFSVNYPLLLLYGFVGCALCELGDLFYSAVKRQFGVKDYGRILPGHGGVLDRLDGMSFAAPAVEFLLLLAPALLVAR